jgi:hypothetical protein
MIMARIGMRANKMTQLLWTQIVRITGPNLVFVVQHWISKSGPEWTRKSTTGTVVQSRRNIVNLMFIFKYKIWLEHGENICCQSQIKI